VFAEGLRHAWCRRDVPPSLCVMQMLRVTRDG
jgi:hypothetical protein